MEEKKPAKMDNNLIYIGAAVVVVLIVAFLVFGGSKPPAPVTTTINNPKNLTTLTVTALTTTILKNITTATGPNLATCNGLNYSATQAYYGYSATCNWRPSTGQSFMNVTIYGGAYKNATITMIQLNATGAPYNRTFIASPCNSASNVNYVPPGNYKFIFTVYAGVASSSCGPATFKVGH